MPTDESTPTVRTAAANAARRAIGDEKAAQRLRDAGWLVFPPDQLPRLKEAANFAEEVEEGTPECALAELGYLCVRAQHAADLAAALDNGEG
ncbi:hypothetical protein ACIODS_09015 [Micromonospora chalcea]|uniref:hypothetical protein n=1 Tax=Micromonospora chalcea TaxID=1874 RepID=UPI003801CB37